MPCVSLCCTCFQQSKQHCLEWNWLAQNPRKKCEGKKGVAFLSLGLCSGMKDSLSLTDFHSQAADRSVFPTAGKFFKPVAPRQEILLQEDAKCSLPSASRSRTYPGSSVSAGALLCRVNHWSGHAGQELLLLCPENCNDIRAWERISAPLAWALRTNHNVSDTNSPAEEGVILISHHVSTAFPSVNIGVYTPGCWEPVKSVGATWDFFKYRHLYGNC